MPTRRYYSSTFSPTSLTSGVGTTDTTLSVAAVSGAPASLPWTGVLDRGNGPEELVTVTGVSGTSLTVIRGVDGQAAKAHASGAKFEHVTSARDFEDAGAHVNDTNLDHHTQYAKRGQGLAVDVGAASRAGRLYIATDSEDLYTDDGTTVHRLLSKPSSDAAYVSKVLGSADSLAVTGLTGSVSASRYVGATASVAPTTGAHLQGDWVVTLDGKIFICTVAGTPGTWAQVGGGGTPTFVGARAFANATQGLANNTVVVLALAGESYDSGTLHDTVTNNSRITVPTTGKYVVTGQVGHGSTTGAAQARILKNGTATAVNSRGMDANGGNVSVSDIVSCTAGDYLELAAFQNSGGTVNAGSGTDTTFLAASLIGA